MILIIQKFTFGIFRTMTYRWDSDFVRPYAWVEPKTATKSVPPTATNPHNLQYQRGNGKSNTFKHPQLDSQPNYFYRRNVANFIMGRLIPTVKYVRHHCTEKPNMTLKMALWQLGEKKVSFKH